MSRIGRVCSGSYVYRGERQLGIARLGERVIGEKEQGKEAIVPYLCTLGWMMIYYLVLRYMKAVGILLH